MKRYFCETIITYLTIKFYFHIVTDASVSWRSEKRATLRSYENVFHYIPIHIELRIFCQKCLSLMYAATA